mmetsp:Transcript_33108/g.77496  ORF Transcript_33108/g.77496 Transcript_33108/m.77496 type:complete len:195 (-) Transcript_33108:126-710(-)
MTAATISPSMGDAHHHHHPGSHYTKCRQRPQQRRALHLANQKMYLMFVSSQQEVLSFIDQYPALFFFSNSISKHCRATDEHSLPPTSVVEDFCEALLEYRDHPQLASRQLVFYDFEQDQACVARTLLLLGAYLMLEEGFAVNDACAALERALPKHISRRDLARLLRNLRTEMTMRRLSSDSSLFPIQEDEALAW